MLKRILLILLVVGLLICTSLTTVVNAETTVTVNDIVTATAQEESDWSATNTRLSTVAIEENVIASAIDQGGGNVLATIAKKKVEKNQAVTKKKVATKKANKAVGLTEEKSSLKEIALVTNDAVPNIIVASVELNAVFAPNVDSGSCNEVVAMNSDTELNGIRAHESALARRFPCLIVPCLVAEMNAESGASAAIGIVARLTSESPTEVADLAMHGT